jgi:transcriptional regulator with XRE-family HTH domain
MRFGDYLKYFRMQKGMTLRVLSTKVNLGFSYLCDIENNRKAAPNDIALLKIASVLKLSVSEKSDFFDLAAESKRKIDKNNFHVPADIGEYISSDEKTKNELRKNMKNNKN